MKRSFNVVVICCWLAFLVSVSAAIEAVPQQAGQPRTDQDRSHPKPSATPAEQYLQKGIRLLERKEYANARHEFRQALRSHPRSASAYFYLGVAEVKLGHDAAAERSFRQSTVLDPDSPNAFYNLGVLLLEEKKPREAIYYLKRANQLGPMNAALALNLVRAYLRAGDSDRAVLVARASTSRFRGQPAYYLAAGKAFLAEGLAGQASTYLEAANRLAPAEPGIVLSLAQAYLIQRESALALATLATVAKKAQNIAEYHNLLAQSYFDAARDPANRAKTNSLSGPPQSNSRVFAEINRAIRINPYNPLYWLALGRFYQDYGQQQEALRTFEQALHFASKLPEIPYSLGMQYFIAIDFLRSTEYVKRPFVLAHEYDWALYILGISPATLPGFSGAEQFFTQAGRLNPRNPYYECLYGMEMVSKERLSEARKHFQRALDLDPAYALAHYQLGRLFAREGDYRRAQAELQQATTLEPDLYEAYFPLGHALQRLGRKREAARAFTMFQRYSAERNSQRLTMSKILQHASQQEP